MNDDLDRVRADNETSLLLGVRARELLETDDPAVLPELLEILKRYLGLREQVNGTLTDAEIARRYHGARPGRRARQDREKIAWLEGS